MKSKTAIVEGFEGKYCILEIDGQTKDVLRTDVDSRAKRGDVVIWNGIRWMPDPKQTTERTRKIKRLMDEVWDD